MPQSGFGENVGQSELAARVGSLKGMLAGANSTYLSGSMAEMYSEKELLNLAGIQFLQIIANATVIQLDMAISEPPAQSIYNGQDDPHGRRLDGE